MPGGGGNGGTCRSAVMLRLQQINDEVQRLRALLHGEPVEWMDCGVDHDFGCCHVRIDDRYHWIGMERGQETAHQVTDDVDELLYWIISSNAAGTAGQWEMKHRHPTADFRRLYFARTVELLARVKPEWAERQQAEWDEVLMRHPFVDGGTSAI